MDTLARRGQAGQKENLSVSIAFISTSNKVWTTLKVYLPTSGSGLKAYGIPPQDLGQRLCLPASRSDHRCALHFRIVVCPDTVTLTTRNNRHSGCVHRSAGACGVQKRAATWILSYRELWAAQSMLETKPGSSRRTVNAFDQPVSQLYSPCALVFSSFFFLSFLWFVFQDTVRSTCLLTLCPPGYDTFFDYDSYEWSWQCWKALVRCLGGCPQSSRA